MYPFSRSSQMLIDHSGCWYTSLGSISPQEDYEWWGASNDGSCDIAYLVFLKTSPSQTHQPSCTSLFRRGGQHLWYLRASQEGLWFLISLWDRRSAFTQRFLASDQPATWSILCAAFSALNGYTGLPFLIVCYLHTTGGSGGEYGGFNRARC